MGVNISKELRSNKHSKEGKPMSRKPRPTVSVGAKISPELADELYGLAGSKYGGNVSEAVRMGIKLLIQTCSHKIPREMADSFHKLVEEKFGGNIDQAVGAAVELLVSQG